MLTIAGIVGVVLTLVGLGFSIRWVQRMKKKIRDFEATPTAPAVEIKCKNCKHWDHDAGQQMLLSKPTFASVMKALTPNDELGEKVFATDPETGMTYVERRLPVFPAFENRWEYFGGCMKESMIRHRTDHCDKFEARA